MTLPLSRTFALLAAAVFACAVEAAEVHVAVAANFSAPLKDIAAEIGLTHEAFYRALAALEADGAIRRARRRIALVHRAA